MIIQPWMWCVRPAARLDQSTKLSCRKLVAKAPERRMVTEQV
jgi:hypothetical protein